MIHGQEQKFLRGCSLAVLPLGIQAGRRPTGEAPLLQEEQDVVGRWTSFVDRGCSQHALRRVPAGFCCDGCTPCSCDRGGRRAGRRVSRECRVSRALQRRAGERATSSLMRVSPGGLACKALCVSHQDHPPPSPRLNSLELLQDRNRP